MAAVSVRAVEAATAHDERTALVPAAYRPAELRQRHLERVLPPDPMAQARFRRITHLATTIFGVATSTVTLVDDHPGESRTADPDPARYGADSAFVRATIESGAPLLVPDATAAAEFSQLDQVLGPPYLRFYAGIPLADDEGVVLGVFCVYDTVPRRLDGRQWAALVELADWARRDLVDSEDMARARAVQESLLPRLAPVVSGYEIAAVCRPTKSVGGDFYDFGASPGRLNFSLVDVMGKGPAAALVAATVRALLRASMSEVAVGLGGRRPGNDTLPIRGGVGGVVTDIDRLVTADLSRTGTLVTGFFCDLVTGTGLVRYVDAGHGLAVVLRSDTTAQWLRTDDLPIGVDPVGCWSDREVTLQPGDTLLCVSDGLLDLLGGTDDALAALANLAQRRAHPDELIRTIHALTDSGTPVDDVTAAAIRRTAVGP